MKKKISRPKVDLDSKVKDMIWDSIIQYTKFKGVKMRWAYFNYKYEVRYADVYLKVKWNQK